MKIVVLGAGPAGLSAAWQLSRKGHKVFLLEKDSVAGGQSRTIFRKGFGFDLGPHNFHTVHSEIEAFAKKLLGKGFPRISVQSKIFYNERWVSYPLKGIDVFTSINPFLAVFCAADFFKTRLLLKLFGKKREESFEDWIVARFGKLLYNIYFKPYASKVWGISTKELSKDCAEKRVPSTSLLELAASVFFGKKQFHPEDPSQARNYYPRKGIGELCNRLQKGVLEKNGKFFFNAKSLSFGLKGLLVRSVSFETSGKKKKINCDFVISTIPLNELVGNLSEALSGDAIRAAKKLFFRSEALLFLAVKKPKVFGLPWVYFSGTKISFNRAYETACFSKSIAPEGKTGICIEFTCNKGDKTWSLSEKGLYSKGIKIFSHYGFLDQKDIEFFFSRHVENAYPVYTTDYKESLKTILDSLSTIKNLITIGRLGLFCYANVDDVIKMGFRTAEFACKGKTEMIDYKKMFPRFILY